jgi:hypothetical protein
MRTFLDHANHNQNFHDCVCKQFNDQFFDWKITILFYVGIHYLKALAAKRGAKIGDTHYEIEQSVNPDRPNSQMKISKNAWREYKNLFNYSRTARYEGITDKDTFEKIRKIDHSYCLQHLDNFKKYVNGQGVSIEK